MASRFYFSSTATTPVTPAFDGAWTRVTEALRREMHTTKDNSAVTLTTIWAGGAAGVTESALARQFVSRPLAAGIAFAMTDTIKCQVLCAESATNDNINQQPITVKVVSQDGNTLRTTLKGLSHIGPNTTEWNTSSRNKIVTDSDTLDANYTTVAGDRLVVEIGGQVSSAGGASVTGTMWFGAPTGSTDLGENETDTSTALVAWFEISRTVTFAAAGDIAGTSLIDVTPTAILLGDGSLAGTSLVELTPAAILLGAVDIAGTSLITFTPTATLSGAVVTSPHPALDLTRIAVGGPGRGYAGFTAKGGVVVGPLAGDSLITFTPTATLEGGVALAGIGTLAFTNTAALAGTAVLAGSSAIVFANSATLAGTVALAGSSAIVFANSATLLGSAAIAGTGAIVFTNAASLTGAGALAGASNPAFTETATLAGAAALAGTAALTFTTAGMLILPTGSILGTAAITFTEAATLTAAGALAGSSALAFTTSATITGESPIAGISPVTFANSAGLSGEGALAGTSQLLFTNTGSMVLGDISGLSSLSFTPQGVLLADGALAGPSVLQFLALASLIDASAPTNPTRLTLSDAGIGTGAFSDTGIGSGSLSDTGIGGGTLSDAPPS
jgi:fibronectin-binding autotransporter adhesin